MESSIPDISYRSPVAGKGIFPAKSYRLYWRDARHRGGALLADPSLRSPGVRQKWRLRI